MDNVGPDDPVRLQMAVRLFFPALVEIDERKARILELEEACNHSNVRVSA